MSRIVYALSGQGRGHSSRVIAVSTALRERGHDVVFCCGGTAREILESNGEEVIGVPALRQVVVGNRLRIGRTIFSNAETVLNVQEIVSELGDTFATIQPDLLITDFEAFSHRAAQRHNIPVLSFNHQEIVTRTRYSLPARYRLHASLAAATIRLVAPRSPVHVVLTSFYFPELRDPSRTTLVRPIIRPAVAQLSPSKSDHVLVYFNQPPGSEFFLDALARTNATFVVYNFRGEPRAREYVNILFKETDMDGFLDDLASCRAVISTAGFTLISEALYLGKPILVVPNQGIFEQTLNALFLERQGLGQAVLKREGVEQAITRFISACDSIPCPPRMERGNAEAVHCIERVLAEIDPRRVIPVTGGTASKRPARPDIAVSAD